MREDILGLRHRDACGAWLAVPRPRCRAGRRPHIACEGVAGLGARKEAWRIAHFAEDAEDAGIPFYLCKETALDLINDVDTVIEDIDAQYGDLVIRIITIDTLNRSLVGSESKDEDMAGYLRAAIALAARFQCLVIIVHHCGYDETHPRGHTSLRGGADADISAKKDTEGRVGVRRRTAFTHGCRNTAPS
jgi:hypothetical protein